MAVYNLNSLLLMFPQQRIGTDCLSFVSDEDFTINVYNNTKNWDGTLYSSTDTLTWSEWDGTTALSSVNGSLYIKGSNNTIITGSAAATNARWVINATSDVDCFGNIETLLDYETVLAGNHPEMAASCFRNLFRDNTSLTTAPALPATTLAPYCYYGMFYDCSNLTTAPALPAETLATFCYGYMFYGCSSLTTAPELPAEILANYCYQYMFYNCSALTAAPTLPATTLGTYCYRAMFYGCSSLTAAPTLPATTLTTYCYYQMFYGCSSLNSVPALRATTLQNYCYYQMFYNCSNVSCKTSGTRAWFKFTTTATNATSNMFANTASGSVTSPAVNTQYYTNNTIVS